MIAGHAFNIFGICTLMRPDGAGCPIRQQWLEEQCFENPDAKMKSGYAHVDHLALHEYEQIQQAVRDKRKRAEEATYAAVGRPIYEGEKVDG